VLQETSLIGSYMASDRVLLVELVLRGQFIEVPERLFYRRIHDGMSGQAYRTRSAQMTWFDPKNRGKLTLPRWRWLKEYLRAIRQAPITAGDRHRCYVLLTRWARWNIGLMLEDLLYAGGECARNVYASFAVASRKSD
jgi:hypothetical protein